MSLPFAEDINFWMTSKASPDSWIEKAKRLIGSFGGKVTGEYFGSDDSGRAAYMVTFVLDGDRYKIAWPVLPTRSKNESAARVQAATLLYHDVKGRCLTAAILGARTAFFNYLLLPDGRTASQASVPELMQGIPTIFLGDGS